MDFTLNNIHALKSIEMGDSKGADQLYMSRNISGRLEFLGKWDKRVVIMELENLILKEDALKKNWIPKSLDGFPSLNMPFEDLLKKANLVKPATSAALNYFMKADNIKLGRGKFLMWHYPIHKTYMTHTYKFISKLPEVFTLSMILNWPKMVGGSISNGFSDAMIPESGITTHLAVCKVLLEASYCILEITPADWLENPNSPPSTVCQLAKPTKNPLSGPCKTSSRSPLNSLTTPAKRKTFQKPPAKSTPSPASNNG